MLSERYLRARYLKSDLNKNKDLRILIFHGVKCFDHKIHYANREDSNQTVLIRVFTIRIRGEAFFL